MTITNNNSCIVYGRSPHYEIYDRLDADIIAQTYKESNEPSLEHETAALQVGIQSVRSFYTYSETAKAPWDHRFGGGSYREGNCINYSWSTAGVAHNLGMTSLIAFCNGHVMNAIVGRTGSLHLINSDDLEHAWYFDAANQAKPRPLFSSADVTAIGNVSDTNSYSTRLNTRALEQDAILARSLSLDNRITPKLWMASCHAGITIMTDWYAGEALQNWQELESANARTNIYSTASALHKLERHNYDHESRPQANDTFEKFLRNTRYWSRNPSITEAQIGSSLHTYEGLLDDSKPKHIRLGDAWRYLANWRNSAEALDTARGHYQVAQSMNEHFDPMLNGKLNAAERLSQTLFRGAKLLDGIDKR